MQDMKVGTAYLKSIIESHHGMQSLRAFGDELKSRTLSELQLKKLFASLWAFYHETPSGILSLALRVNDFWKQRVSPWDAMEKTAYLLNASMDEFGLEKNHERFLPTHHQLFLEATDFYNVSKKDLFTEEYILSSGRRIGELSAEYYREKTIAAGLGFHFASELTSYPEFTYLYEGFSAHKDYYQLESDQDAGLKLFSVHTNVEPLHVKSCVKIVDAFLEIKAQTMSEIIKGATVYMDSYAALFNDLKAI